ncbi:MAG: hypothetical protein L3K03_06255 [Thermoplasmata archaeon]|nr:hypothetical protein [Thermoplasmata archaeon]
MGATVIATKRIGHLLTVPVFVYASLWLSAGLRGIDGLVLVGAVASALPILGPLSGRPLWVVWFAPPVVLGVGVIGSLNSGWLPGSWGVGLLGAVLATSPLPVAAWMSMPDRRPLEGVGITFAGLILVVILEAAKSLATIGGASASVGTFALSVGQVNGSQLAGIQTLLGGTAGATLPLQTIADPLTVALMLLALGGVLLAYLDPASGVSPRSARLAAPWTSRTSGQTPMFLPLGIGVAAAIGFELVAAVSPTSALFATAVGILVVISVLIAVA